jgi:hypothetical protein
LKKKKIQDYLRMPCVLPFGEAAPELIFREFARHIGIGGIALIDVQ